MNAAIHLKFVIHTSPCQRSLVYSLIFILDSKNEQLVQLLIFQDFFYSCPVGLNLTDLHFPQTFYFALPFPNFVFLYSLTLTLLL